MQSAADVRIATAADAGAIVELVNRVAAEDRSLGVDAFPFTPEVQARFLENHDPLVQLPLVAVADGEIVGYLHGSRGTSDALRHVSSLAIVVERTRRRSGVGQALLTAMANWAHVVGVRKMTLSVLATNEDARRLFERQGYAVEARRAGQFHVEGRDVDELMMARWIGEPAS